MTTISNYGINYHSIQLIANSYGLFSILSIKISDFGTKTDFLTVHEVAELLRLSVLTIYKYIKEGQLEAVEFGGHYRVASDSLDNFIKEHKVGGQNEK